MKRILIITDSLGLPRPEPDIVIGSKTWPQLLKPSFEIIQLSLGGSTIEELYNQTHYYKPFHPDIIIVQAGIVDCAPRALSRLENLNLNSFWFTRGVLSKILPKYGTTIRKFRSKVYTPLPEFEKYVHKIISRFDPTPVFWIGIVPAQTAYEEKVTGITANINQYNQKLAAIFKSSFIDLAAIPAEGIATDYHHLTESGNAFVAARVLKKLEPFSN